MRNPPTYGPDSRWTFWADLVWTVIDLFGELVSEMLSSLISTVFDA
jgi:hypothetical protein